MMYCHFWQHIEFPLEINVSIQTEDIKVSVLLNVLLVHSLNKKHGGYMTYHVRLGSYGVA